MVLASTLGLATAVLHVVKTNLKATVTQEQSQRLSAVANAIDQKFISRRLLLRTFSRSIELENFRKTASIQPFLEQHGVLRQAFANVAVIDAAGSIVGNLNGLQRTSGIKLQDRPYFSDTISNRTGVISEPLRNRVNGRPEVQMTEPIFDAQGRVSHVLVGSINLQESNFLGELANVKFGQTGYMFIVNTDGIVIDHPQKSRILSHYSADGGRNAATTRAVAGFEGSTEGMNRYGVYGLYSYKRIQQTNWILGALYPANEAFAVIDKVGRQVWIGACILALIAGGLSLVALRHSLAPLSRLAQHMHAVQHEPRYIADATSFRADEIGQLGQAFDTLMRERQNAQDRLQLSQQRLLDVLAHAGDAFISIDKHSHITEWNRQAELTFGWTREEAIGQSMAELIIPADLRQAHHAGMASFVDTGQGPVVDKRIQVMALHRDGHLIPVELSVSAERIGDHYGANAFLRDISERERAEKALEQSERRTRLIANNMPVLISHLDLDFRYTYVNTRYQDWFKLPVDSMVGHTVAEVFGQAVFEGVRPQMETAMAGQPVYFELTNPIPDSPSHMAVHYIPDRDTDGRVIGVYGMVRDQTEAHDAKVRLEASERRLRAVTDNLPVLIAYIDAKEHLRFLNATFQDWLGVDPEAAIGQPLSQVVGPALYEERRLHLQAALRGERVEFDVESIALGKTRYLHTIYVPDLQDGGGVAGVFTLSTDVTELKRIESDLAKLARVDALTGLPNRRQLDERLEEMLLRRLRTGQAAALIFMDIDHFKAINDGLGHAAGDLVLKQFAKRLSAAIRVTDTAVRLAGDEFVVLLEGLHLAHDAAAFAEKLLAAVRMPIEIDGSAISVTTSMGIAYLQDKNESAQDLLARADRALYKAKAAGRDGYELDLG